MRAVHQAYGRPLWSLAMGKGNPNIGQHSREGARASVAARRARRSLTLDRVEQELGHLETVDDAMRRLDRICLWALGGLLPGVVANASVRSVEVWLKASESKLTEKVVEELQADLERVKRELKGR